MGKYEVQFGSFIESELNSVRSFTNPSLIRKSVISQTRGPLFYLGLFEYLENNDIAAMKLRFFQGGLALNHYSETYVNTAEYFISGYHLSYIIMSDNKELYELLYFNCYSQYIERYPDSVGILALFQIATGDWEGLQKSRDFIAQHAKDRFWQNKQIWLDIYDGFLHRDGMKIVDALNRHDTPRLKSKRKVHEFSEAHISPYGIALVKLAIQHNIEIEIESPFYPKALLSYNPLDEYTIPYKHLRDYYRPLGYTWRYDPVYPELQDWENDPENPDKGKDKGGFFKRLFS